MAGVTFVLSIQWYGMQQNRFLARRLNGKAAARNDTGGWVLPLSVICLEEYDTIRMNLQNVLGITPFLSVPCVPTVQFFQNCCENRKKKNGAPMRPARWHARHAIFCSYSSYNHKTVVAVEQQNRFLKVLHYVQDTPVCDRLTRHRGLSFACVSNLFWKSMILYGWISKTFWV